MKITADAIIVAAGSGMRFGGAKQRSMLLGKPMYLHSLERFYEHPHIDKIVVVVSVDLLAEIKAEVKALYPSERISVVVGGDSRQASVRNGLSATGDNCEIILVHDAARPGVSDQIITDVIEASAEYGAALAAIKVVDTLKSEKDGCVDGTVSREHLWRAQTPQGAKKPLLLQAFEQAASDGYIGTDEIELLERIGVKVRIVAGSEENLKVTFPNDLLRLEKLLGTSK